jgi:hypothetical protein
VTDHDGAPGRAVAKLFGALLMAVGGLMAGLCGLCSAGVVIITISGGSNGIGALMMLVLIFGGPPIAIGTGLFLWGRSLWLGPTPSNIAEDVS